MKSLTSTMNKLRDSKGLWNHYGYVMNVFNREEKVHKKQKNDLTLFMRLKKLSLLTKEIANLSIASFSLTNQEKLQKIFNKFDEINALNDQYLILQSNLKELENPIRTLEGIKQEYQAVEKKLNKNDTRKETMVQLIEMQAKLACTQEQLNPLYIQRNELLKKSARVKKTFLKEYTTLKRKLSLKKYADLLLEREKRAERLSRILNVNVSFEDAVDQFTITLYDLMDASDEAIIGNDTVQIYEELHTIEAKFMLQDVCYLVSISSLNDSIKIGKLVEQTQIKVIGFGYGFDEIEWKDDYNNSLITHLFQHLRSLKKDIHYKTHLETDIEHLKLQLV
ncbi:hypothetical protein SFC65_24090 [Priestia filamentosa]|uniref:hypothetical protein n=1 Tax=Priestia filamentosa TaxID=1402861 RepID=UPI0039825DA5